MIMDRHEIIEKLNTCIEKHCPNVAKLKIRESEPAYFAEKIMFHLDNAYEMLGHNSDGNALKGISSKLDEAISLLDTLSETSKRKLHAKLVRYVDKRKIKSSTGFEQFGDVEQVGKGKLNVIIPPYPKSLSCEGISVLSENIEIIKSISEKIAKLSEEPLYIKKLSNTLSYEAIAVAKACKMIWRDKLILEHENSPPTDKRKKLEPNKYVSQYYDDPMGDFITEVFKILKIKQNVSSIMQALERHGGEDKLSPTIEVR